MQNATDAIESPGDYHLGLTSLRWDLRQNGHRFAAPPTRRWRLREPWCGELTSLAIGGDENGIAAFTAETGQRGLRVVIAIVQADVGTRLRTIGAVATTDPLASFTDAGIVLLFPGMAERMNRTVATFTDAEWNRRCLQEREKRLRVTDAIVRGVIQ